jgi:hypothetical protein
MLVYFLNYDELETNNSASRYRKKKTEKTILLILRSRTFSHSVDPKLTRSATIGEFRGPSHDDD